MKIGNTCYPCCEFHRASQVPKVDRGPTSCDSRLLHRDPKVDRLNNTHPNMDRRAEAIAFQFFLTFFFLKTYPNFVISFDIQLYHKHTDAYASKYFLI
jgi:hypothetical protein